MKKIYLLALILLASAGFNTISAKDKKKDKKKKDAKVETVVQTITPTSMNDSLSYAAGMTMTRGLDSYLKSQLGISDAQMPDFLRGLKEGIANRKDSVYSAYAAGIQVASQVDKTMLPGLIKQMGGEGSINTDMFYTGFMASLAKDTTVFNSSDADQYVQTKQMEMKNAKDKANREAGEKFMAENKTKPGVITLPSGLQYKVLVKGTGEIPSKDDEVTVVYEGRTLDGKVFDATSRHGTPNDTFGVGRLIKGWTEALTMMPVGSKWEIYIPQELAYGERGAGNDIAPYSALIFTLELQGVKHAAKPVEVPEPKAAAKPVGAKGKKTPVRARKK